MKYLEKLPHDSFATKHEIFMLGRKGIMREFLVTCRCFRKGHFRFSAGGAGVFERYSLSQAAGLSIREKIIHLSGILAFWSLTVDRDLGDEGLTTSAGFVYDTTVRVA